MPGALLIAVPLYGVYDSRLQGSVCDPVVGCGGRTGTQCVGRHPACLVGFLGSSLTRSYLICTTAQQGQLLRQLCSQTALHLVHRHSWCTMLCPDISVSVKAADCNLYSLETDYSPSTQTCCLPHSKVRAPRTCSPFCATSASAIRQGTVQMLMLPTYGRYQLMRPARGCEQLWETHPRSAAGLSDHHPAVAHHEFLTAAADEADMMQVSADAASQGLRAAVGANQRSAAGLCDSYHAEPGRQRGVRSSQAGSRWPVACSSRG